jgi:hypothetical protein
MSVIAWGGKSRDAGQSREARKVNSSKDIGNSRVDSSTRDISGMPKQYGRQNRWEN